MPNKEMNFEWDEVKSFKVEVERGASFEELSQAIESDLVAIEDHPTKKDQSFFIVRFKKEIWAVVVQFHGKEIRIVTAYPSRKWRKKYGI